MIMPAIRRVALVGSVLLVLLLAGNAHSQSLKDVRIALPFPNGPAFPYYSVAEEMGYFSQEGLKVVLTTTAGSGAAFKALVAGQVDFAHAQPAQILNGLAIGEETVSFYILYQGHVFQFATPAHSPYKEVASLKGTKVGVSSVAGGQYSYLIATLEGAGLAVGPGKDVEVAEVGRGGAAGIALKEKRISAYSASFVDMMVIKQQGIDLRLFQEGPTATFFSDTLTARRSALAEDPETAIRLSRALAKATVFCFENEDACWRIIAKHVPDTAKKPDFTKPLLHEALVLHQIPPEAKGRWGHQRSEAWEAVHGFLQRSGQLQKPVDISQAFTNEYLDVINQFDVQKVKADARNYK